MPAIARQIALWVLNALDSQDIPIDTLFAQAYQEPRLSRRDRALATELVYGVLRWREKLDWIIRKLSTTPFRKIHPQVLNIIRLGVYQLVFLSKIPPSAAVNDAVELAKDTAPPWTISFVNAVLRAAQLHKQARCQDGPS